jgi:hypothetical protein
MIIQFLADVQNFNNEAAEEVIAQAKAEGLEVEE